MAFFFVLFVLSSIGLPGTNGFVSEFLTILGAFTSGHLGIAYGALAALGIILGALYMLHMTARVIWGPLKYPDPHAHEALPHGAAAYAAHGHAAHGQEDQGQAATTTRKYHDPGTGDLTGRETAILVPLAVAVIVLGVMPTPVLRSMLRPVQALRTPVTAPQRNLAHIAPDADHFAPAPAVVQAAE
jgi:NADH-quinone oxidoreductase subunit M